MLRKNNKGRTWYQASKERFSLTVDCCAMPACVVLLSHPLDLPAAVQSRLDAVDHSGILEAVTFLVAAIFQTANLPVDFVGYSLISHSTTADLDTRLCATCVPMGCCRSRCPRAAV